MLIQSSFLFLKATLGDRRSCFPFWDFPHNRYQSKLKLPRLIYLFWPVETFCNHLSSRFLVLFGRVATEVCSSSLKIGTCTDGFSSALLLPIKGHFWCQWVLLSTLFSRACLPHHLKFFLLYNLDMSALDRKPNNMQQNQQLLECYG